MKRAEAKKLFVELYRGLERAHGIYELLQRPAGGKKVPGKARTVHGEVTAKLWDLHFKGTQGLGIVPIMDDFNCWFGAVDIDKYDLHLPDLEDKCAALGIPVLPTRTKSGGVHLYVFGAEPLPAQLLKSRLEEWAIALGFGGAEVFPKQTKLLSTKDIGNWINMPYFGTDTGSTERYGILHGKPLELEEFVDRAMVLRITVEQLNELAIKDESADFLEGPPCLQSLARSGFPEGMRNNGLFAVGVYLKKRYPDDWASHILSYNVHHFKPPLSEVEVRGLIKTLGRKDYNFPCSKPPISNFCNRNLCRTREFGVGKGTEDWGLVIDSAAQKVDTDPPYWIITVNGQRMTLFSDHILNQRFFAKLCVEKLGLSPPVLPGDKWRAEMNKMMMAAELLPAPPDASVGGELGYLLEQYCTVYPQAETREEILTGKPYTEEGEVHFRAADFKKFLDAQKFRALNGVSLYARLRQIGVGTKQYWIKDRNILVWCVKEFARPAEVPPKSIEQEGDM